ncbi:MAG: tRNA pseudouridine(55) synthase TruB [Clostridia bacterium]|nr:tRNA pseudouridine(55) synthase TruB [Clostridia bacterium]
MAPDGILLINKPQGITSHDAVYRLRRLLRTQKIGHTGTLDPDATGLLVVLAGRASKAAEYVTANEKTYRCTFILGITTDTQDVTGAVTARCEKIPGEDDVLYAVSSFTGEYAQIPPMYSALKRGGRKLVDLARRGVEIEREPRTVCIRSVAAEKIGDAEYSMTVTCSKGTYVRTLCDDIGKKLGCGAAMSSLCRLRSGEYSLDNALTLKQCEELTYEELCERLIPTESLFYGLPVLRLPEFYLRLCKNGCEIYQKKIGTDFKAGECVRLYDGDGFFALGEVGEYDGGSAVKSVKVFRL